MGKAKEKSSAKSGGKSKKLDLIAADLASMRAELKKLVKQQADLTKEIAKLVPAKPELKPARASRKPPTKPAKSGEKPVRPVLVQSPEAAIPAGRTGAGPQ
jgi:outer membrane protein TolC